MFSFFCSSRSQGFDGLLDGSKAMSITFLMWLGGVSDEKSHNQQSDGGIGIL